MSKRIKNVIFFKIENKFAEWVKTFDKIVDLINPDIYILFLFIKYNKDDPKKVICNHQAPGGNIQKFVQANSELINSHKVDFSTMEEFP